MNRRRQYSRRVPCSSKGCPEAALYHYERRADYDEAIRRNNTWTCCRHSATTVLSPERLRSEWISEPSKPLERYPDNPYRSFGSQGVLIGEGFYAEGKDFPIGTRIKITAEVILPDGGQAN